MNSSDNIDDLDFFRFADLKARRIVSDRADLFRKQQRGFPRAVKLTKGQGAVALFPKRAVAAWLHAQMAEMTDADVPSMK